MWCLIMLCLEHWPGDLLHRLTEPRWKTQEVEKRYLGEQTGVIGFSPCRRTTLFPTSLRMLDHVRAMAHSIGCLLKTAMYLEGKHRQHHLLSWGTKQCPCHGVSAAWKSITTA